MMVTIEEAKTKWCPFSRAMKHTDNDGVVTTNRIYRSDDKMPFKDTLCLATACMSWRWGAPETQLIETPTDKPPSGEGWQQSKDQPKNGGAMVWKRRCPDRLGFCGLAGPARCD